MHIHLGSTSTNNRRLQLNMTNDSGSFKHQVIARSINFRTQDLKVDVLRPSVLQELCGKHMLNDLLTCRRFPKVLLAHAAIMTIS